MNHDLLKKMLFMPDNNRDLREQYPELAKYPEFSNLNKDELYFVYFMEGYFSNMKNMYQRVEKSFDYAFGSSSDSHDKKKFLNGDYGVHIAAAIKRWQTFDAPARMMAQIASNKAFENISKLIDIDIDQEFKDDDDFTERKQYVDMVNKAMNIMPELIKAKETGYGFKSSSDKSDTEISSMIELWHRRHRTT